MESIETGSGEVSVEECKDLIREVLQNSLVCNGRISLDAMNRTEIDYAIYLLRKYSILGK